VLILPDVRELNSQEREGLKKLAAAGKQIVATGTNALAQENSVNASAIADCPCRKYAESLDKNLENADPAKAADFFSALHHVSEVEVTASPQIASSVAAVDGKTHTFLANFSGLRSGLNPIATPQKGITIRAHAGKASYLPFLGESQSLPAK